MIRMFNQNPWMAKKDVVVKIALHTVQIYPNTARDLLHRSRLKVHRSRPTTFLKQIHLKARLKFAVQHLEAEPFAMQHFNFFDQLPLVKCDKDGTF